MNVNIKAPYGIKNKTKIWGTYDARHTPLFILFCCHTEHLIDQLINKIK